MPVPQPTVDELVEALKRSGLPTILVEGVDDMTIFRWLEEKLGTTNANALPCGNRDNLLALYVRRSEFVKTATAFVADRDLWLFTAVPPEYGRIVFTLGYCIENDLYAGAEAVLKGLMSPGERADFDIILDSIIEWFAFEVEEYLAGREAQTAHHLNEMVPLGTTSICAEFRTRRGLPDAPDAARVARLREHYALEVRGKQLFEVLLRFLSASARSAKYSRTALFEMALKLPERHEPMVRLMAAIQDVLAA